MIRYCFTKRQDLSPCDAGWGACSSDGCSSCMDEPQEKNCHNLVDENTPQTCPYCGNILQKHGLNIIESNVRM